MVSNDFFDLDKFQKVADDVLSIDDVPGIVPNPNYWPTKTITEDGYTVCPNCGKGTLVSDEPGDGSIMICDRCRYRFTHDEIAELDGPNIG